MLVCVCLILQFGIDREQDQTLRCYHSTRLFALVGTLTNTRLKHKKKMNIFVIVFVVGVYVNARPAEEKMDVEIEQQKLVEIKDAISPNKLPSSTVNPGKAEFNRYPPQVLFNNLGPVQKIIYNLANPKPIVDTIKESDKFGNNGERLARLGRGFVGGVQSLTELFSSVVSSPVEQLKAVSRKATEQLNNIGGFISGL